MKRFFGVSTKMVWMVAAPAALLLAPLRVIAQTAPATLQGKVVNPAGLPLNHGDMKLTTDRNGSKPPLDRKFEYSFTIDANGNFSGKDIAPGEYLAVVAADGKIADYQNVTLKTGEAKETLDFDMSRADYIKAMSSEDRAAL